MGSDDAARHAGQFRRALEDGDHMQLWSIWAHVFPHLPGPKTPEQAQIVMHAARTETASIPFERRAYSHAWLSERGLPSRLPDELKPKAEQLHPRIVDAVGIAVKMPRFLAPVAAEVQRAMGDAVEELAADGADLSDRRLVHGLMFERRASKLKHLLGTTNLRGV